MSAERLELVRWYAGWMPSVEDQIRAHRKRARQLDAYTRGQVKRWYH